MQNVFQNIECRCRLRVEQPVLELFCFEDNDAMTQFQFELRFPSIELAFWWPEISWKPSTLAVTLGPPLATDKIAFAHFYQKNSQKTTSCSRGHSLRDWLP